MSCCVRPGEGVHAGKNGGTGKWIRAHASPQIPQVAAGIIPWNAIEGKVHFPITAAAVRASCPEGSPLYGWPGKVHGRATSRSRSPRPAVKHENVLNPNHGKKKALRSAGQAETPNSESRSCLNPPSDPLHLKRAATLAEDLGIQAVTSPTPTSRYRSMGPKLRFLAREIFFYSLHEVGGE